MDEKITAEWARKQSDIEINKTIENQLEKCELAIIDATSRGEGKCFVYFTMIRGTGDELRRRGFEVIDLSSQKDGEAYQINW